MNLLYQADDRQVGLRISNVWSYKYNKFKSYYCIFTSSYSYSRCLFV